MAGISFYNCNKCDFRTKHSGGFPYAKDKITGKLISLRVPLSEPEEIVIGHSYTEYCSKCCKSVQVLIPKDTERKDAMCPLCSNTGVLLMDQDKCPKCKDGEVELEYPKVFF